MDANGPAPSHLPALEERLRIVATYLSQCGKARPR